MPDPPLRRGALRPGDSAGRLVGRESGRHPCSARESFARHCLRTIGKGARAWRHCPLILYKAAVDRHRSPEIRWSWQRPMARD
jgi:hypothetical protein